MPWIYDTPSLVVNYTLRRIALSVPVGNRARKRPIIGGIAAVAEVCRADERDGLHWNIYDTIRLENR
jgi:hypothetical protein